MLCVCFEKQTVLLDLTAKVAAFDLWTLTFSIAFYCFIDFLHVSKLKKSVNNNFLASWANSKLSSLCVCFSSHPVVLVFYGQRSFQHQHPMTHNEQEIHAHTHTHTHTLICVVRLQLIQCRTGLITLNTSCPHRKQNPPGSLELLKSYNTKLLQTQRHQRETHSVLTHLWSSWVLSTPTTGNA